jgi:hypothetical protein
MVALIAKIAINVCHFCERRANEFADSGGKPSPQLVAFIEQQARRHERLASARCVCVCVSLDSCVPAMHTIW